MSCQGDFEIQDQDIKSATRFEGEYDKWHPTYLQYPPYLSLITQQFHLKGNWALQRQPKLIVRRREGRRPGVRGIREWIWTQQQLKWIDLGLWNLEVVMREAPIWFPVSSREGSREFQVRGRNEGFGGELTWFGWGRAECQKIPRISSQALF